MNICVNTIAYMYEIWKVVPFTNWRFMDGPSALRWLLVFIRAGWGDKMFAPSVSSGLGCMNKTRRNRLRGRESFYRDGTVRIHPERLPGPLASRDLYAGLHLNRYSGAQSLNDTEATVKKRLRKVIVVSLFRHFFPDVTARAVVA